MLTVQFLLVRLVFSVFIQIGLLYLGKAEDQDWLLQANDEGEMDVDYEEEEDFEDEPEEITRWEADTGSKKSDSNDPICDKGLYCLSKV